MKIAPDPFQRLSNVLSFSPYGNRKESWNFGVHCLGKVAKRYKVMKLYRILIVLAILGIAGVAEARLHYIIHYRNGKEILVGKYLSVNTKKREIRSSIGALVGGCHSPKLR